MKETLFKVTDENFMTCPGTPDETKWGESVKHVRPGGRVCTKNVLHAFPGMWIAAYLCWPMLRFKNPVLWESEGEVVDRDVLKVGCTELRTIRQIPMPEIKDQTRVLVQIMATQKNNVNNIMTEDEDFREWSEDYVENRNGAREDLERIQKLRGARGCSGYISYDAAIDLIEGKTDNFLFTAKTLHGICRSYLHRKSESYKEVDDLINQASLL
jgi:hypothetical protein